MEHANQGLNIVTDSKVIVLVKSAASKMAKRAFRIDRTKLWIAAVLPVDGATGAIRNEENGA